MTGPVLGQPSGSIELQSIVPHVPPVLSLSRLEAADEQSLTACVEVESDSIFCDSPEGVPVWVALEYLGQAVAALEGLRALSDGRAVPKGYLLGTRQFVTPIEFFPIGAELKVKVAEVYAAPNGLAVFDGCISMRQLTLECRFSVYRLQSNLDLVDG